MIIFSALIRKNKIQNFIYYYFKLKYKSCFLSAFNELFITKDFIFYFFIYKKHLILKCKLLIKNL